MQSWPGYCVEVSDGLHALAALLKVEKARSLM
jgi:hypothetical protein